MGLRHAGLLVFPCLFALGCGNRTPPMARSPDEPAPVSTAAELDSIRESLRKPGADAAHYRQALDQLNSALERTQDRQPAKLTPDEISELKTKWRFNDDEIASLNRSEFS